jgi:uncharacterized protein YjbJ (UPF0337 family)
MHWDQIAAEWKQFTGKVEEKWGKLTGDDLTTVAGKRDQLAGLLQQRYKHTTTAHQHSHAQVRLSRQGPGACVPRGPLAVSCWVPAGSAPLRRAAK